MICLENSDMLSHIPIFILKNAIFDVLHMILWYSGFGCFWNYNPIIFYLIISKGLKLALILLRGMKFANVFNLYFSFFFTLKTLNYHTTSIFFSGCFLLNLNKCYLQCRIYLCHAFQTFVIMEKIVNYYYLYARPIKKFW